MNSKNTLYKFLLICLLFLLFNYNFSEAKISELNYENTKAKLEQVKLEIANNEFELDKNKQQLAGLITQEKEIEASIKENNKKITSLYKEIKINETELENIDQKIKVLREKQNKQQELLKKQIINQYKIGINPAIKLFLNQSSRHEATQYLHYLSLVNKKRNELFQQYKDEQLIINTLKEDKKKNILEHENLLATVKEKKEILQAEQINKVKLQDKIEASIQNQKTKIAVLKTDEKNLNQLINKLELVLKDIPTYLDQNNFAKVKGKLIWPTEGKIISAFGQNYHNQKEKNAGIIIAAPEGKVVKSIYSGRVVYSDWLRGFGLIVIIEHGDGFMSLYGNNQTVYKEIGEWVEESEVIALVGKTGSMSEPGLYFEIRKNGKPQNPKKWLQSVNIATK